MIATAQPTEPEWLTHLRTEGYCVVPGAIADEQVKIYREAMLDWAEGFNVGFKRDDPSTWVLPDGTPPPPFARRGGLVGAYGVAHEKFVWEVRQEQGVLDAFKTLWGTEELLVSFDAVNFSLPVKKGTESERWAHIDQEPIDLSHRLTQGFVMLTDSGPDDGGLLLMTKSHKLQEKFFEETGGIKPDQDSGPRNFYLYNDNDMDWWGNHPEVKQIKVEGKAGDLVLWDSRTVHWNCPPRDGKIRMVIYTCYYPKSLTDPDILPRKAEVFETRQRTSHWPQYNVVLAPPETNPPDPYARSRPFIEPVVTDTILKLVGIKSY